MPMPHVLLVEDDATARLLLADVLSSGGYEVSVAPDGETALQMLDQSSFDVVLTDLRMRGIDGVQVMQAARNRPEPPAVVILTGFGSLESAIAAVRAGAADYLLKPCAAADMLKCLGQVVQHRSTEMQQSTLVQTLAQGIAQLHQLTTDPLTSQDQPPVEPNRYLAVGKLVIDTFRHSVMFNRQPLRLTPIEYALLVCLAKAQGRVVTHSEIVREVHGYHTDDAEAQSLLKVHVHNVRRKIDPAYLVSVRGIGYLLAEAETS